MCLVGEMSIGEVSIWKVSVGDVSVGEMSVGELSGHRLDYIKDLYEALFKKREQKTTTKIKDFLNA